MTTYNKVSYNIKSKIIIFCKNIFIGLSKPNFKFILCMTIGIIASKFVMLSDIAALTNKEGETKTVKVSYTPIELPKIKGKTFYLVMVQYQ